MLESIIARTIWDHLERHRLINDSHHGFTKGRCSLTNLLSFYNEVKELGGSDKNFDPLHLYFSKAFDMVPRQRLLHKVEAHGIDRKVLEWIRAWLYGRS